MTGRPPGSDHGLLDPDLHDLCHPENLHRDHLGHQILYPAQQGMSAEAVWVPPATSGLVQSRLSSEGSDSLCVRDHGSSNTPK